MEKCLGSYTTAFLYETVSLRNEHEPWVCGPVENRYKHHYANLNLRQYDELNTFISNV